MNGLFLDTVLHYQGFGYSIIPVGQDKKPLIAWGRYQKQKTTEEEIRGWWDKWPTANIGIVTGMISGLAIIDIDTEEGKQAIQEYIQDSLVMPVVNTPSGGQHLYFKCPDEKISNNSRTVPGCDLRANGGYIVAPPSSNGNGKAYTWQEGLSIHDVGLPELPSAYLSFINNSFIYKKQNSTSQQTSTRSTGVHKMFIQGRRDDDLFHTANCLIKGGMDKGNAFHVLDIVAKNCIPPYPEAEVAVKVQSAVTRCEARQRNLSHEVREYVESTNGHFMSTEVHKSLDVSTKQEKKNISEILRRLCSDGIIERYSTKNGCFRRIDDRVEEIDFLNADDNEMDLNLPFSIDTYVNIYPKSVIVVAGSPNAGKTAFLLNIAAQNMEQNKIYYFSSEMSPQELKIRLSKFDRPLKDFTRVKWLERSGDFADLIRPDDINIIDFLEVHEDFWRVGLMIKQIFDKLNKGVAIIALQKNVGNELGLGATRSLEKARLYITMNPNELKIVKAKNWRDPLINPNGMWLKYKLYQGWKFSMPEGWQK